MTNHNSSQQPPRPPQPSRPPRRPGGRFFDSIRDSGLRRTVDGRWIGGVSGAIAERTGIDRTLIRGLTVVLCLFFGIGVLLYGLAWLFLPEPDGRIHAEGVLHGVWSGGFIGSAIVVLLGVGNPGFHAPFLFWPGNHGFWSWFGPVLGIGIVVAIIIYAVNHHGDTRNSGNGPENGPASGNRQDPGSGPAPASPPAPGGEPGVGPSFVEPADDSTTVDARPSDDATVALPAPDYGDASARSSSPAGTYDSAHFSQDASTAYDAQASTYAPYAGYGQDTAYGPTASWQSTATRPTAPPAPRMITKPAGGPMTLLFSGLAILGLAAGWLVDRSVGLPGNGHLIAVGIGVAVLGIGIILAGAWGRRGGGMTGWAWIGLVLAFFVAIVPAAGRIAAVHDGTWAPTTVQTAEHGFSVGIGTTRVDLAGLAVPKSGTVTVPVNSGIGDVSVTLPADTSAKVQMMGAGRWDGGAAHNPKGVVPLDPPGDGSTGTSAMRYGDGPAHLIVKIRMGIGNVSVAQANKGAH